MAQIDHSIIVREDLCVLLAHHITVLQFKISDRHCYYLLVIYVNNK